MLNVEPGRHIDHQFREEEGGWEGQNRNELGKKNIPSLPFFSKKKKFSQTNNEPKTLSKYK